MKNKKIKIIIITILVAVLIILFVGCSRNYFYNTAINNIKYNYNNTLNKKDDLLGNLINKSFSGTLKRELTSNMVHSVNQVYEEKYDFSIEKDDKLYIYLDNNYTVIDLNWYFNLLVFDNADSCKYLDKETKLEYMKDNSYNVKQYNYLCNGYSLSIYTSSILNKYIKSVIAYDDVVIEFRDDFILYKNGTLTLKYSNIKNDSYTLEINDMNREFKLFYSFNNNAKYSFVFNASKFNIIVDDNITLSMNCDTKKYSKLKITLIEGEIKHIEEYNMIEPKEMLISIFSEDIYSLFN